MVVYFGGGGDCVLSVCMEQLPIRRSFQTSDGSIHRESFPAEGNPEEYVIPSSAVSDSQSAVCNRTSDCS